jgi:hypothetical protein
VPRGCHEVRLPVRNDAGAFKTGSTGLSGSGRRVDRATREPTQGVSVVILEGSANLSAELHTADPHAAIAAILRLHAPEVLNCVDHDFRAH